MTEPPPLCMMCKQPMHRLRNVPVPNGLNITVWRCRSCPRPPFADQAMVDASELDSEVPGKIRAPKPQPK